MASHDKCVYGNTQTNQAKWVILTLSGVTFDYTVIISQ